MRLDPDILADLNITFQPSGYLRAMPLAHRATPLGLGLGRTRFSSPTDDFKLLYVAENLTTSIAETIIRDRFVDRRRRRIHSGEVEMWGVAEIQVIRPMKLLDLRTTGLTRLGVSTDAVGARDHRQGRALSQALYDRTDADGILYRSRLTGAICCAVYDRAVGHLTAGTVVEAISLVGLVPALDTLNVGLMS